MPVVLVVATATAAIAATVLFTPFSPTSWMPQTNAPRCLLPASKANLSLLLDSMHLAEPLDKHLQGLDLFLELLAHRADSL
eukprot:4911251-Lingulodinium_polyedra.AAC.1